MSEEAVLASGTTTTEIESLKQERDFWRNLHSTKQSDFFKQTFCAALSGILGNSFIANNYNEVHNDIPYEKIRNNNVEMAIQYANEAVRQLLAIQAAATNLEPVEDQANE